MYTERVKTHTEASKIFINQCKFLCVVSFASAGAIDVYLIDYTFPRDQA